MSISFLGRTGHRPMGGVLRWVLGVVLSLLLAGAAPWGFGARAQEPMGSGPEAVIVSVPSDFPPYYQVDPEGRPRGFAIEVMDWLAQRAGIRVTYLIAPSWIEALEAVRDGRAQLIPNVGITPKRRSWLDFTLPLETFPLRIFVRKETPGVKSLEDLHGGKVGVVRGNAAVDLLKARPEIRSKVFPNLHEAIMLLIAGHIDAVVYPGPVMHYVLREAGLDDRVRAVGKPLIEIKRAVGLRKGLSGLRERLDLAVKDLVGSKEYQEIYTRWFGRPRRFWSTSEGALVMGGLVVLSLLGMGLWRYRAVASLNRRLGEEIVRREHLEEALERSVAQLEQRVKEQTRELQENANYLRNLIRNMADGILVLGQEGGVRMANPAAEELLGRGEGELIGEPFAHPIGVEGTSEVELLTKSGERRVVEIRTSSARWQGKEVQIALLRDITPHRHLETMLREAKEEAEAANRAKSTFLANMSHELRTPLNAVLGFSQVLLEGHFGGLNPKQREYVESILTSGRHLLSVINDILDLSQVEAGERRLQLGPMSVRKVVEEAVWSLRQEGYQKGIAIGCRFPGPPEELEIKADARLVRQVITNLLSNAIKFTPAGGAIEAGAFKESSDAGEVPAGEEYVRVWVADTGVGLPPQEREKVFKAFYQARSGLKDKPKGTGLGLALCRRFVGLHGGRIWVESEGEGRGSRFVFVLPVRGPAPRAGTDVQGGVPTPPAGPRIKDMRGWKRGPLDQPSQ